MRKSFWGRTISVLLVSALAAGLMTACDRHEVSLDRDLTDSSGALPNGSLTQQLCKNFTAPAIDEEIVVLKIKDRGEVKIKLFPEETPNGVENFKTLVNNGYYDELIFHRVVDDFVVQGGDPTGTGYYGDDCWKKGGFAQTISGNLNHVTGAVAYAIGKDKLNKSQFYVVTGKGWTDDDFDLYTKYGYTFNNKAMDLYKVWGGQPTLDGGYEIFGQVFDGLEVFLEIQKVEVDSNYKPKKQVVIEKAEVVKYDGSPVTWLNNKGVTPEGVA